MTDWADEKARRCCTDEEIAAALRSAVEEERRACEAIARRGVSSPSGLMAIAADIIADAIATRATATNKKGPAE